VEKASTALEQRRIVGSVVEQNGAPDELSELLSDWARHLRGRNRAPRTIDSYLEVGRAFREYLLRVGHSTKIVDIDRRAVEDYLFDLSERTHQRSDRKSISAATVARHYRSLQQLFRWLELEEEIELSPFTKMSPPAVPEQPVPLLTSEEIARLLASAAATTLNPGVTPPFSGCCLTQDSGLPS
jgi:site-specific recombinase XerD